jgi:hypothetical protein
MFCSSDYASDLRRQRLEQTQPTTEHARPSRRVENDQSDLSHPARIE